MVIWILKNVYDFPPCELPPGYRASTDHQVPAYAPLCTMFISIYQLYNLSAILQICGFLNQYMMTDRIWNLNLVFFSVIYLVQCILHFLSCQCTHWVVQNKGSISAQFFSWHMLNWSLSVDNMQWVATATQVFLFNYFAHSRVQ